MFDIALLLAFVSTFMFVSLVPGMCMTLSMTLGISIGIRRSLHFMWGELLGVMLVGVSALIGIGALMLKYPMLFTGFKLIGGVYLAYLGVQLWQSRGRMSLSNTPTGHAQMRAMELAGQGFVTAVANPKAWAFLIALLPPFIQSDQPFVPQAMLLIALMLVIEFAALLLYASGGKMLRRLLDKAENVRLINRIAGTLMIGVAIWLAFF